MQHTSDQNPPHGAAPAIAAEVPAEQWLLSLMGEFDFTLPHIAYGRLVKRLATTPSIPKTAAPAGRTVAAAEVLSFIRSQACGGTNFNHAVMYVADQVERYFARTAMEANAGQPMAAVSHPTASTKNGGAQ